MAILYLDEHKDADEVVELVKQEGRKCLKFSGDVAKPGRPVSMLALSGKAGCLVTGQQLSQHPYTRPNCCIACIDVRGCDPGTSK